jgi:hypothetical protein
MTLLGLAAMVFYAVMLATGVVGLDVMPQFMVSAVIFLSSGRLMRMAARNLPAKEVDEEKEKKKLAKPKPDWEWLSQFLNWAMALIIIGGLALWIMKPIGVSMVDAIQQHKPASQPYYSDSIP